MKPVPVVTHLLIVSDPTRQAPKREQHGEHACRQSHRTVNDATIEVEIRVQPALYKVFVLQGNTLQVLSDVKQWICLIEQIQQLVGRFS